VGRDHTVRWKVDAQRIGQRRRARRSVGRLGSGGEQDVQVVAAQQRTVGPHQRVEQAGCLQCGLQRSLVDLGLKIDQPPQRQTHGVLARGPRQGRRRRGRVALGQDAGTTLAQLREALLGDAAPTRGVGFLGPGSAQRWVGHRTGPTRQGIQRGDVQRQRQQRRVSRRAWPPRIRLPGPQHGDQLSLRALRLTLGVLEPSRGLLLAALGLRRPLFGRRPTAPGLLRVPQGCPHDGDRGLQARHLPAPGLGMLG
jgi:hypothetical protein